MRRFISILLALLMLVSGSAFAQSDVVITHKKDKGVERWLWDELSQHSPSDEVTAGVLSYFWRESQFRSDSVSGWATTLHGQGYDLCKWIRKKTDKGLSDGSSRKFFLEKVRECGGYGLGQWYRMSYLEDLYDFASEYGTSIGDARMQCEFVFHSLKKDKELWRRLKKCKDPVKAGRLIAIYYDGSQSGVDYMGYKAGRFYNKYHEEGK